MDWINIMTSTIDYIEDHLADDIMYDEVAKIACCSMHQFGCIFSYIVGIPLSEYIRRRRLTLSALELQNSNVKIIDIAMKYGYNSPAAFTRAFLTMHGIPPRQARSLGVKIKAYPRITFNLTIKGNLEMEYRIEEKDEIHLLGVVKQINRQSANTTSNNWKESLGEVWHIWEDFFRNIDKKLYDHKLYRNPMWQMGFTKTLENGETLLAIGAEAKEDILTDLDTYVIPANKWAVFTVKGSLNGKDHPMNAMWTRITTEWLPTFGYKRAADYELEIFPPGDTNSDDYTCEIWVPIIANT